MSQIKLTWEDLRDRARNHNELSGDTKIKAVAAYDKLENIFHESFFDLQHPLFSFFFDRSGWRHEWAIWFAEFLASLKAHPDYDFLIEKLKNPDFFGERMTVLKIAELLSMAGFIFRFDTPVLIGGVRKEPDLFVQLTPADAGFFLEVSTLGRSEKQREADRAFEELFLFRFHWPLERCCGHLERTPAPAHLIEVKSQIENLVEKVRQQSTFEAFEIPGLVKFACAAESRMEELERWAHERGLKTGEFCGPSVNVDEFERISFKLKDKIKQVPTDRANVIVLYSHLFTMPLRETAEFAAFVHALEDVVYRHSHVGYLVLIFSWIGTNDRAVIRYRDHICVNRLWLYFDCNSILLIRNRFAKAPMDRTVEDSFLRAFTEVR